MPAKQASNVFRSSGIYRPFLLRRYEVPSARGWIEVKWENISEKTYKLRVKVPFDTTAVICLPAGNADRGELLAGEYELTVTAA